MATQPCPNIAEVVFKLQSDAQDIQNTMYFEKGAGWSPGDMATLASAAEAAFLASMLSRYTASVTFIGAVATDLTSLSGERAVTTPDFGNVGTQPGGSAAANVAWAFQEQTGSRGRGKQGRNFYGPIPGAFLNGDLIDSTEADNHVTAVKAMIAAIIAAVPGAGHVVLSRWNGGVKRAAGIGLPVTDIGYSNLYLDSQKDRLPFHKKRKKRTP